jgi:hypothetical protein
MQKIVFFISIITSLIFSQNTDTKNKIVVLIPNYVDGIDHKGCIDLPIQFLEQFIEQYHPLEYVRLDKKKLREENIEFFYIYNKKYCKPIGRVLKANLYLMTNIKMVKQNSNNCLDITYDIEMKVYSDVTQKEKILVRYKDVTIDAFQENIKPQMENLFLEIIELNKVYQ